MGFDMRIHFIYVRPRTRSSCRVCPLYKIYTFMGQRKHRTRNHSCRQFRFSPLNEKTRICRETGAALNSVSCCHPIPFLFANGSHNVLTLFVWLQAVKKWKNLLIRKFIVFGAEKTIKKNNRQTKNKSKSPVKDKWAFKIASEGCNVKVGSVTPVFEEHNFVLIYQEANVFYTQPLSSKTKTKKKLKNRFSNYTIRLSVEAHAFGWAGYGRHSWISIFRYSFFKFTDWSLQLPY